MYKPTQVITSVEKNLPKFWHFSKTNYLCPENNNGERRTHSNHQTEGFLNRENRIQQIKW